MKKYRYLFLMVFTMFVIFPFRVNALVGEIGDKVYTVETKKIEDYVCDELKGHSLSFGGNTYNKIIVNDEDNGKQYLVDFSKNGLCEEFDGDFDDEYVPTEYIWEGNKLYLGTYNLNVISINSKTLDKELDLSSSYAEKKEDGYYHVDNPVKENLSNYYEAYWFELAKGEFDEDKVYYEIVKNEYVFSNYSGYFQEAVLVQLDETTYEEDKYYVLAEPEKKELLVTLEVEEFIVPKDKSGLDYDFKLTKADFSHFMEFGNKKYLVLYSNELGNPFVAYFDEKGNYQAFGFDTLLVRDMIMDEDGEFLSFVATVENKDNLILLDKNLNVLFMYDVSEFDDMTMFIGYNENTFYYLIDFFNNKILEVNTYYLMSENNQKYVNKDLVFKFSGLLDKVKEVKLYDDNENEVTISKDNYTLSSGSTVLTLKKEYLDTLLDGTYNLKISYEDGGYVNATFMCEATSQGLPGLVNPDTFDGIDGSIFMGIVSLVGLVSVIVYLRRNKVNM